MKNFFLLFVVFPFISSCQKHGFDLDNLSLPTKSDNILKKYKNEKSFEIEMDSTLVATYDSKDEKIMWFKGLSLSGSMTDDEKDESSFGFSNHITFYSVKSSNQIEAYNIHIETKDITQKLIKLVEKEFGKTEYYYKDNKFSSRIWEKNGILYFFATNNTIENMGEKTITSDLTLISTESLNILNWFTSGGSFAYYGDFLKEKRKNKIEKYSYKDFVIQQEIEAKSWGQKSTYYSKNYVK